MAGFNRIPLDNLGGKWGGYVIQPNSQLENRPGEGKVIREKAPSNSVTSRRP